MSSIDFVHKRVVWTDRNSLGMNPQWAAELKAEGYEIIDRRQAKRTSDQRESSETVNGH